MITRKKPTIDTNVERSIITGMIISNRFLKDIQSIYRPNILRSKWTNLISSWCMEFYEKYQKPPASEIEDIFRRKKATDLSEEQSEIIEQFLVSISDEYENGDKWNAGYYYDKAEEYFRLCALENHRFELSKCISGGRIDDGEAEIANFKEVSKVKLKGINPFATENIIRSLDEHNGDRLFKFHGALGDSLGYLERGHLFGIVASSSTGKSWWLQYIALRSLINGYKTLFVSLEMSENQMTKRIQHWATGLPTKKYLKKYNGNVLIPVWDCIDNQNNKCDNDKPGLVEITKDDEEFQQPRFEDAPIGYTPCCRCMGRKEFKPTSWYRAEERLPLNIENALKKGTAIDKLSVMKKENFKVVEYPDGELSLKELNTYLDNLEYYENFLPDTIIVDGPDNMSSEIREFRHGINSNWKGCKGIGQKRHCLVVAASQGNALRKEKDVKRGDWSEDIRKYHVLDAGMMVNQTKFEKNHQIYRVGAAKNRHDEFDLIEEIMVLNALSIGRPYIDSYRIIK